MAAFDSERVVVDSTELPEHLRQVAFEEFGETTGKQAVW